jgi:hypothetical protein
MSLRERAAVITGEGSGIGKATFNLGRIRTRRAAGRKTARTLENRSTAAHNGRNETSLFGALGPQEIEVTALISLKYMINV